MNHVFVVDASVAVKWLVYEEFTDRSQALLRDSRQALRPLLGPPLLASEVTNALYKKLRIEQSITEAEVERALSGFFSWPPVQLYAPPGLYQRAFSFARSNNLDRAYDSQYVVLAEMLDAEFWTDDRELIRVIRSVGPVGALDRRLRPRTQCNPNTLTARTLRTPAYHPEEADLLHLFPDPLPIQSSERFQ